MKPTELRPYTNWILYIPTYKYTFMLHRNHIHSLNCTFILKVFMYNKYSLLTQLSRR